MFRDAQTLKLKPVTIGQSPYANTNVVVLPAKFKAQDDNNTYFALFAPGGDRAAIKDPTFYPVEFDQTVPENAMDMGMTLLSHLYYAKDTAYPIQLISKKDLLARNLINKDAAVEVGFEIKRVLPPLKEPHKIDRERFIEACKLVFGKYPLCKGQSLLVNFEGMRFELNVTSGSDVQLFFMNEASKVEVHLGQDPALKFLNMRDKTINKTLPLDFAFKGVGGHKKALENLVREAFFSRANPGTAKKLGIKHAKGVLLYGPPGTGKTLIARTVANMFPESHVKVVNGPEVLNKLVGQSEENIRNLFSDAEKEMKIDPEDGELHVIIFDEFDAIASARGIYSDNTGVKAGLVTQLSSFLDGYLVRPNVLIICTTNRIDLIDSALLRPGRIDTHIEIGLPNVEERLEILRIMTSIMVENNLLDRNVDLMDWANKTKDYSGAELQALVSKAGKHYLRYFFEASEDRKELRMKKDMEEIERTKKVTDDFFEEAFREITPAYGIDKSRFQFDKNKFAYYDEKLSSNIDDFKQAVADLEASENIKKLNVLISGGKGTGKTELAKNMASQSGATNIRVITANDLLTLPLNGKLKFIMDEFKHAQQTKFSAIILDGLEDILKSDIYQNVMQINIDKLLEENAESPNKCVIIATTNNPDEIAQQGLDSMFSENYQLSNIHISNLDEAKHVLGKICEKMGYTLVTSRMPSADYNLDMPIRELRSKIDRFCLHNKGELKLDQFFTLLNEAKQKLTNSESLVKLLGAVGSPVYQIPKVKELTKNKAKAEIHFGMTK